MEKRYLENLITNLITDNYDYFLDIKKEDEKVEYRMVKFVCEKLNLDPELPVEPITEYNHTFTSTTEFILECIYNMNVLP